MSAAIPLRTGKGHHASPDSSGSSPPRAGPLERNAASAARGVSRPAKPAPQVTPTTAKTATGERTVIAPKPVLTALAEHRRRQRTWAAKAGSEWNDAGWVFTDPYGDHLTPDHFLTHFQALTDEVGLPPIRLHDLRHGAATLARAAGVDLKTVSAMLGHSSVTITADIYTSVVDEAKREAANLIADLLAAEHDDEHDTDPDPDETA